MLQAGFFAILIAVFDAETQAAKVDFVRDVRPILQKHCYKCHGQTRQKSGLRLDVKSAAFKGGDGYGPSVVAGQPKKSPLIEMITSDDEYARMPPEGAPLSDAEIRTLVRWVSDGADWPDGVDLFQLEDRLDHWSFKSLTSPAVPFTGNSNWPKNSLDRFVFSRLKREGLMPARQSGAVAWLRRVTLDLTGLPPTPAEVDVFLAQVEIGEVAYEAVVDRLLQSPRYGERWAQHWLDVVRYADTHGFEVNTERPNAWPYRDYVINAFHNDTPYDQFIKEQIVGDATGHDAATGFLVTASVLLPGQIGKDAPSIRLARQDSLDEIVNNIGQTFLGLSVGCARCHDHKFDPISAKDYYSMQAFVAGVEYADREIHSSETESLRKEVDRWREQVSQLDRTLSEFAPLAHPSGKRRPQRQGTNARENSLSFPPVQAKFVRFTIHDSNRHPSLGLIEPCLDEFEVFTDEARPQNVALTSMGTRVTASGSKESTNHQLRHVNDGLYGNSHSWMSNSRGRGWLMLELPQTTRISKVVWGRDRTGKFTDRRATAYTLEAGPTPNALTTLAYVPPPRRPVQPTVNTDRFSPISTTRVRFTILATNSHAPCIDELEVYNVAGENVALASRGTILATSGSELVPDRHEPRFVHDGLYGNTSSWMSSSAGKGWVELKFVAEEEVERIVWGRDREGKFKDRLPVQYRIEVKLGDSWRIVADSTDRRPWTDGARKEPSLTLIGLTKEKAGQAKRLLHQKQTLESRIKSALTARKAFAGTFRQPDDIHLLRRGDPEQPVDQVLPAVPVAIGNLSLPESASEQERRLALAEWIASPGNPLTARVMANRIWQWHFGNGLVETANDFGRNGAVPSHPELLDWLSQEFIRSGWSIKRMHRLIVLSATYRQSTEYDADSAAVDADSQLLWRFPSRRLEAEAIRDCMIAVSGRLNLRMGGRGFNLFNKRGGLSGFTPVESFAGDGLRRMIYAHKVRRERDAVFGAFDCPDAGQSTPRRVESTTPVQALNLFNSRITIELANAFAARVENEVGDDVMAQIERVYKIAFSRKAAPDEIAAAEPIVRTHGLETLCRVVFNSNEFLFLP